MSQLYGPHCPAFAGSFGISSQVGLPDGPPNWSLQLRLSGCPSGIRFVSSKVIPSLIQVALFQFTPGPPRWEGPSLNPIRV